MAKIEMYSVFDMAVKAFMPLFGARTKGEAIRMFAQLANEKHTNVCKYPTDYWLAFCGFFDDNSGLMEPLKNPERIIGAVEVLEKDDIFPPEKEVSRRMPM